MSFADRAEAGRRLAERLEGFAGTRSIVAGLARGGVPVAAEIARRLDLRLEVLVVRKIGAPGNREYGIGAVGEDGHLVASPDAVATAGLSDDAFRELAREQADEVARRVERYRGGRSHHAFTDETVILVDDGLATGVTARAGVDMARRWGAATVVLAIPVGALETVRSFDGVADDVVCLETPAEFRAVGNWYADFNQVTDDEVVRLLADSEALDPPTREG